MQNKPLICKSLKAPSFLYRLLSPAWFLFWLLHAFIHAFKYKEWTYIPQRLGFLSLPKSQRIWIHVASVGEVNLIKPLCDQLMVKGHAVTISTFSATGLQRAKHLFSERAHVITLPMDCWPISYLFVRKLNANCALITETELWPETLYQVAKTKIPLIQINARLSNKSLKSSRPIKSLLKQTLAYFTLHLTRYPSDVANLLSMGVDKNKIRVMGSLKHAQIHANKNYPNIIQQAYILFASTHDNEEQQFASLLSLLNDDSFIVPLFVIAPRHPTRLDSILKSLLNIGIDERQIAIRSKNQAISSATKIYLADTLGEMNCLFRHALIVTMGGSFVDIGGHNLLEPASLAKCIITGPSDDNIKQDIKDLKQQGGIIQVANLNQLKIELKELLNNIKRREKIANNAADFVDSSQHVLDFYSRQIATQIDQQLPRYAAKK